MIERLGNALKRIRGNQYIDVAAANAGMSVDRLFAIELNNEYPTDEELERLRIAYNLSKQDLEFMLAVDLAFRITNE